jgi:hypothetical protein
MNNPFVQEQAKQLVKRGELSGPNDGVAKIRALYRIVYGRQPDDRELDLGQRYLQTTFGNAGSGLSPWEQYAQVLLLANEFAFVD